MNIISATALFELCSFWQLPPVQAFVTHVPRTLVSLEAHPQLTFRAPFADLLLTSPCVRLHVGLWR
jgi:hypothetical protein